jgi:hypothetical protein
MATLNGKIFKVLPLESGEGKNGTWKKQPIVLEIDNGKYQKKVAVTLWGNLANGNFEVGKEMSVEYDVESREYNEKWYTDVKAWRINNGGTQTTSESSSISENVSDKQFENKTEQPAQIVDDLPF